MPIPLARILIADDEPLFLKTTGELLTKAGYECRCVSDATAALEALARERFDLVLSDLNMPGNLRLELLHHGRTQWPEMPLIVITGVPSLPTAIESLRLGIADYLLKPVSYRDLLSSIRRTLGEQPEPAASRAAQRRPAAGTGSPLSRRLSATARRCWKCSMSSTGLRDRHQYPDYRGKRDRQGDRGPHDPPAQPPCPAAFSGDRLYDHSRNLFESVLFGHAQAPLPAPCVTNRDCCGKSTAARRSSTKSASCPAFCRRNCCGWCRTRRLPRRQERNGAAGRRFICATNRDLELDVNAGRFRRDLFYRLAVLHIELPPLRERGDDVLRLADHFLTALRSTNPRVSVFAEDVRACFRRYHWPGNIRELRNVVERALALARSTRIELADLPAALQPDAVPRPAAESTRPIPRRTARPWTMPNEAT